MTRVRVVKVRVEPHLVLDDGEQLLELAPEVHEIAPADWPKYSAEIFPRELREFEKKLARTQVPKANRATRRAPAARARKKAS